MKRFLTVTLFSAGLLLSVAACAQNDKSKRPSPPAKITQTLQSGAIVTIDYSQPSLKGRTMGKDIEPKQGQIWRAGANEATVFETSRDVKVEGQDLPAGKYALFMTDNGDDWTITFNKVWNTWGAYDYEKNKAQDALQVKVKPGKSESSQEKLTYTISEDGKVSLLWGTTAVNFKVE